jgi:lipopolysaccharide transport system permease protein
MSSPIKGRKGSKVHPKQENALPMKNENSVEALKSSQMDVMRIEPLEGWVPVNLLELWQHRELLFYLVKRDVRASYASTGLGVFWTVLQPLATAIVITIVLGMFARIPSGEVPYGLVVLSGLVLWGYFATAVQSGCQSMLTNAHLMTKVYFPRLIIPAVPVMAGLVDLLVLVAVLLGTLVCYGIMPAVFWLFIPVPMLLMIVLTLGTSLWLSALNVQYRDVGRILPVILQIGVYASPIIYPYALIPENWRVIYGLNPIVGIVIGMRWALFREGGFPFSELVTSIVITVVILISGIAVFQRFEKSMADIV